LPPKTTTTSPLTALITVGAIAVGGYVGYATAFPSDRKQVRTCITSMLETSRGQVGYGELRDKLLELDRAESVVIVDETRRDFGDSTLVTFVYQVDGRTSRIVCGQ